jgi:hypothetical protein
MEILATVWNEEATTMYVRFVVGGDAENTAWLTGIITEAQILRENGELYSYEIEQLETIFAWFCPEAKGPVGRMWDVVAILREHGVPVRLVTTEKPGKIVYSDEYQVVAETPYWA